jgi:methionyl-tRNA formyltransferase
MHGDTQTGVTLIKMDEKVDHGPIIAQKTAPIGEKDRRPQLEERLTAIGYELFKKSLSELATEFIITHEQDHSQATFTKRLTKHDGFIESSQFAVHSSQEAHEIFNKFRGLYPWPGIWTVVKTKGKEQRLKIKDMDLENGKLLIKKVQLEGKKEVAFETFKRAYGESLL